MGYGKGIGKGHRSRAALVMGAVMALCLVACFAAVGSDDVTEDVSADNISGTLKVQRSYGVTSAYVVQAGKTATVDLNGHRLQSSASCAVFEVYGTLTLKDTAGGGLINAGTPDSGGAIWIAPGGKVIVDGVTFYGKSGTSYGGIIYVSKDASLTISNSTLYEGQARDGGAIYVASGGSVTMRNCTIDGSHASDRGGSIYVATSASLVTYNCNLVNSSSSGEGGIVMVYGTFEMNGGTMSGSTGYRGGAVYVSDGASFTLNSGTITGNKTSSQEGGGLFVYEGGTITMNGGTISNNTASTHGGGVHVMGSFYMNGGTISNNTASNYGGGIALVGDQPKYHAPATAVITAGTIEGNSGKYGGGIYIGVTYASFGTNYEQGKLTMTGGTIRNNTASDNGGGIYSYYVRYTSSSMIVAEISNATISGNTTAKNGGGIYGFGYNITKTDISNNTASGNGGGIYGLHMTISGGTISGNTATNGGSIYNAGSLYCKYAVITGGTATEYGGNIYSDAEGELDSSTVSYGTAKYGGGVYIDGGVLTVNDGSISYNKALIDGGGVYTNANSCSFNDYGCEIQNNEAARDGGGVFANHGTLHLLGGYILYNTAGRYGGGVHIDSSTGLGVYIGSVRVFYNLAGEDMTSGVYLGASGKVLYLQGAPRIAENGTDRIYGLHLSSGNYPHVLSSIGQCLIMVTSDTSVTKPGDSVIAYSLEDPNDWVETIDSFYCPLANTYVPCWVGTGYIQYSEPRCLVIYYPNFGDSTRITAQTYTYTNTVERAHWYYEDYTLQGWALEPDGEIVYHSGDEISGFTDRTTPLRLYAVWVSEYYNLTLSTPDGSVTKSYQLKTYAEAPLSTNATLRYFERDGYSIIGWSTDKYATTPEYKVGESYYYLSSGATSITLYPVWQAKTVTVTWQDTDGTVLLQESVAYGTVPSYSGEIPDHDTAETSSTLSGWSQEVTSTVLSWSPVIGEVTEDTVYTAVYTTEVQTHNLTINVNDPAWGYASVTVEVPYGTVVSIIGYEITLTYGDDSVTYIAEPEESTEKYTYYLDHWIVDGVELDEMDGYKVEDDVEITAVFDIAGNSYVVSFDANGGEGTMPVQVMTYGEETELSAVAFTNESYTFVGWATSADGSPVYADSQSVVEVGEVTLYAIWARNTVTVSVSAVNGVPDANLVNAPVGSELVVEDYQVKINGITVVALPEETGDVSTEYRISHWEVDGTEFTGTVTLAADTSVVAVFEEAPATVVIVWCDYDGTILSAEVVDYGTTPVYTGETPTREPTEYIEYEFSGWSEYTTNSGSYLMTAEYTEYTRMYTVTAGMDADDGYGLELLYDIEVPYGADIGVDGTFLFVDGEALVAEISAANEAYTYEFLGWDVEDGSKVTGDMVIVAYYSVIPVEYTVTWTNLDGTVLLEQQVAYGTVPEYTGETPVYVDTMDYAMAFVGWSPSVTEVTGDTEYMAMYSEVYTISFDSAGGFGSMSSVSTARTEDTTLASCSFLRLGYSFAGWATEEGGEIAYMDGAVVTDLGQGGETVTLYAVWEEDSSSYAALAGMAVAILVVIGVAYALVRTYRN